jgi:hypothetical protein
MVETRTLKVRKFEVSISHNDVDKVLFAKASSCGLIQLTESLIHDFPSPLHRQIWPWSLVPSEQYNYSGDILTLIKDTVARFRPNQLSRSDRLRRLERDACYDEHTQRFLLAGKTYLQSFLSINITQFAWRTH